MELTGTENAVLEGEPVPLDDADIDDGTFTGDNWADKAVAALEQKRADAARHRPHLEEDEPEGDPDVTKVFWQDGRPADKPITLREAQRDYAKYRADAARTMMEGVQADWDAAAAQEGAQIAEPEQQQTQEPSLEEQWAQYYETLPPEQKVYVETAAQFQQRTAQTDALGQSYELALVDLAARLNGAVGNSFSDIRTPADVERLARENPQRFSQLQTYIEGARAIHSEAQRVSQARAQQQAAHHAELFRAYAAEQDKVVGRLIPELADNADGETRRRLQLAALDTLKSVGFTDRELYSGWREGAAFSLRDARVQKILADASRWNSQQSAQRELPKQLASKRAHAPRPQKPGISSGIDTAAFQSERNLADRLQKSGSIHDAVNLYRARLGRR